MPPFPLTVTVAALVLAAVHVVTPSLHGLQGTPRSVWLSIAGGVSVAYVFIHLLPELAAAQEHLGGAADEVWSALPFAERHVYLVALAGLAAFYGLDRLAKTARSRRQGATVRPGRGGSEAAEATAGPGVFWVHVGSFAVYNLLVGYLLLHREGDSTLRSLAFFAVAMALHFLVTDFGLDEDHKGLYRRLGRWLLAGAVLLGAAVGVAVELSLAAVAALTAFLAGGVILNVLKEEVPSERQSRFWAFALGMAGYAALLLTL